MSSSYYGLVSEEQYKVRIGKRNEAKTKSRINIIRDKIYHGILNKHGYGGYSDDDLYINDLYDIDDVMEIVNEVLTDNISDLELKFHAKVVDDNE